MLSVQAEVERQSDLPFSGNHLSGPNMNGRCFSMFAQQLSQIPIPRSGPYCSLLINV